MNGLLLFQEAAYGLGEEHRLIIGMRHHEKVKLRLGIARHTCNRKEGEEGRRREGNGESSNDCAEIARLFSISVIPQMGDW